MKKISALDTKYMIRALGAAACVLVLPILLLACSSQVPESIVVATVTPRQPAGAPTTVSSSSAASMPSLTVPTSASTTPTSGAASQSSQVAAIPTPACNTLTVTPGQTEGPYYKAGSPERTSLFESGTTGTRLVLTGYVLTADCKPVAGAWLDFWQADARGNYDNSGYKLRGHQLTDATGRYQLTTVVPGLYPGRTEHIHVKVQAPKGPVLTTQLYFPDVSANSRDSIYDPKLLLTVEQTGDTLTATFNFVIRV